MSGLIQGTVHRALVVKGSKSTGYPLDRINFVETESDASGRGNVLFMSESIWPMGFGSYGGQMRKGGFIAVADAERVGNEMQKLMERRRSPGAAGAEAS